MALWQSAQAKCFCSACKKRPINWNLPPLELGSVRPWRWKRKASPQLSCHSSESQRVAVQPSGGCEEVLMRERILSPSKPDPQLQTHGSVAGGWSVYWNSLYNVLNLLYSNVCVISTSIKQINIVMGKNIQTEKQLLCWYELNIAIYSRKFIIFSVTCL